MDFLKFFQNRSSCFQIEFLKQKKKYNTLSALRVIIFVTSIILIVYFANQRDFQSVFLTVSLFFFIFGILINVHNKVEVRKNINLTLFSINQEEIQRYHHQLESFDDGSRYIEREHPYLVDLDIFGKHSVFQLLNRCSTKAGRELLAYKLKHAPETKNHKDIQDAVEELAPLIDWRQEFQAFGYNSSDDKEDVSVLQDWLQMQPKVMYKRWLRVAAWVLPLVVTASFVFYFLGQISYMLPFMGLFINILILSLHQEYAMIMYKKASASLKSIQSYEQMIKMIEDASFQNNILRKYQESLKSDGTKASNSLKELKNILNRFDSRSNMFYWILNTLFLFDIFLLLQSEKWKQKNRDLISLWLSAASEVEVLSSLGGYTFLHPEYTFAKISQEEFVFSAGNLGHPLIEKEKRIVNDFNFQGKGKICLITGSNMSGKSTFLRTVGVNSVLGMIGAPVCASKFHISSFQVFTSMRTTDNLSESVSSFYAELKRIKQLLEITERKEPVLFILDEILKGTNSRDRHQGAAALINQLSQENCFGFISTHDLELGQLHDRKESIINYSFNSTVEGDEIKFDYKLHDGLCNSFNASKLMQQIGIRI